jgi:hypothetical protein
MNKKKKERKKEHKGQGCTRCILRGGQEPEYLHFVGHGNECGFNTECDEEYYMLGGL